MYLGASTDGRGGGDVDALLADAARSRDLGTSVENAFSEAADSRRFSPEEIRRMRESVGLAMDVEHNLELTRGERRRRRQLGNLENAQVSVMAGATPERIFRPGAPSDQWLALMEVLGGVGVPKDLSLYERAGLHIAGIGRKFPSRIPQIMKHARKHVLAQVGGFVEIFEDGSPQHIIGSLEAEYAETGIGYEANLVTESAKSEAEAKRNIRWLQGALRSGAKRLAIKPTCLVPYSNVAIATPSLRVKLRDAFCEIFQVAQENPLADGQTAIITIDSEHSDILRLVSDAFIIAARNFPKVRVQLVGQAYAKDTETLLLDPLMTASKQRVQDGGVPLGMRLVGGANEKGEKQHVSAMGWSNLPIVGSRAATHANYMHLRSKMIDPIKDGDFTLTIASMNLITMTDSLIELARAGVLASQNGGFVSFSMLRGMTGQEIFRYLKKKYGVEGHEYIPVIPMAVIVELFKYYLRRIDELATKDGGKGISNYLAPLCRYGVDSPEWAESQVQNGIIAAVAEHKATDYPLEPGVLPYRGDHEPVVEPKTLAEYSPIPHVAPGALEDSNWIDDMILDCEAREVNNKTVELQFNQVRGDTERRALQELRGPTRPDLTLGWFEMATEKDVSEAMRIAREDRAGWEKKPADDRIDVVMKAVGEMRENRDILDKALIMNSGKSILEADGEVNEAMDFLNLSALQMKELLKRDNLEFTTEGDGVAVVICPKNFPMAIPLVHIIARLMAGYRVIVKPSGGKDEESTLATYEMVKCLWDAGVPKDALIFLPCNNDNAGELTKQAERVGYTGSTAIARKIHKENPKLDLLAETGGRNFVVVDSSADLKVVAHDMVKSVCGFGGQKCSKAIGLIATADVDMEELKAQLLMQLKMMVIANALVRRVDATPLSKKRGPGDPLYEATMNCLPGEEWLEELVASGDFDGDEEIMELLSGEPAKMGDPGIRFIADAANFDFSSIEEIFAPIFTVTQIDGGVEEAVDKINGLAGGLTGALFSENRPAIAHALKHWKTGNLYINRGPTGAMGHQGFGDGVGDAHEGAHGAKTGTPEWLMMNGCVKRREGKYAKYEKVDVKKDETGLAAVLERLGEGDWVGGYYDPMIHAGWSCLYEYDRYFSQKRPAPYQTVGQYDWIESHKVGRVLLRVSDGDRPEEILGKIFAAVAARNPLRISVPSSMEHVIQSIEKDLEISLESDFNNVKIEYDESDIALEEFIKKNATLDEEERVAFVAFSKRDNVSRLVAKAAVDAGLYIDWRGVTGDGLNDMITQFRQQSFCWVYHTAGDTSYEDHLRDNGDEVVPYRLAA
jgi:RHH-type transcriptional regulator, proline utilization regulon repressor / proline dehydrogenase / delta 1-pyrroline-5-carboxylate dehydrogenase